MLQVTPRKISLCSLAILIIAAIDNIRNLPAAALFGSSLIFFFALAAVIFLIPTALISAELSATFSEKGGIYQWVNRAFGEKYAMAAIWLQWINTMVWYPTMLSFIAGTFAYAINPDLAEHKGYLISCILIIFWGLTLINLKGLHLSTRITNICATMGTIIPMMMLILMGVIWLFKGNPIQLKFTKADLIPSFSSPGAWVSLIAIMASFLGIELAGVHVNDIRDPQKNFPKAILIATLFIFFSMVLGALAISAVLPVDQIQLVSGVMQVFSHFFHNFGLSPLIPVLTFCIGIGSIGTIINWLISPAKGLLHAAEYGFLPRFFSRTNSAGVAYNILLMQAVFVTLACFLFLFAPSVNAFYWFFTALSTEIYMIMYVLMFAAALRLHYTDKERSTLFKIPGKAVGIWITALLGIIGCLLTIIISFFPPEHIEIGSSSRYLLMIIIGNIATLSPLMLFYLYKKSQR